MRAVLTLLALGACSYPEKELTDGAGAPFGCINAPTPTTANNPVRITGNVVDAGTAGPFNNAAVAGYFAGSTTSIFDLHTDANGAFSVQQNTGSTPLDLHLAVSANGYSPTNYYPANLVTRDVHFPVGGPPMSAIQLFDPTAVSKLQQASGVTLDTTKGHLLLNFEDCNGTPLSGGTVTTSPAGTIVYFRAQIPDPSLTSTGTLGVVLVANLPPVAVTVNATAQGKPLKTHNLQVVAGAFIQAEIAP
jgi:hypothetical protein